MTVGQSGVFSSFLKGRKFLHGTKDKA